MDDQREGVWLRGLGWIEAHRRDFALPEGPPGPSILAPLKGLGELVRVGSVLLRGREEPVRSRLVALLDWAWSECREGAVFFDLVEARPSLLMAGALYSIFDREGYRHEPTREVLARVGLEPVHPPEAGPAWELREAGGIRLAADAPAVLALGLAEGWKAMGLPCRWSVERLLPRTILGRHPEGRLSVDEGYSVAHAALFATAFGADPSGLDGSSVDWLERRAPSHLSDFLAIPNLDVFSELVLALASTGRPVDGAAWERALSAAQREDGSLPAPERRESSPSAAQQTSGGGGPNSTSFRRDYHVTLAAILASAALENSR